MSLEQLRNAVKGEKITFGSKEVLKKLRQGAAKKIFLATTCPQQIRDTVKRYTLLQKKTEVIELPIPSSEVALICKKNYPVSILSC